MVDLLRRFLLSRQVRALVTKYVLFAAVSIAANLGTQWVTAQLYSGPYEIYVLLVVGTAVGLVVKYVLDKQFIFFYQTAGATHDLRTFLFYSAMGIVTTVIFWGSELFFHATIETEAGKYIGGFIGLVIGYTTKYFLDRKWVFRQ